jgi:hypothetical protein
MALAVGFCVGRHRKSPAPRKKKQGPKYKAMKTKLVLEAD